MAKLIFLDVDGTLCDHSGAVPNSAKLAIKQARKKGHQIFLCTGRSKPEITEEILSSGLDGIIGAGGGYIEIGDKIIQHKRMPEEAVLAIISYFKQHDIAYYLESNDGLFGSENCAETIEKQVTFGLEFGTEAYQQAATEFNWFYDILAESAGQKIDYGNVNKISFISNGHPYQEVAEKFQDQFAMYHTTVPQYGPESGEIAVKGIDKNIAVEQVLDYLDILKEETYAYGDGNNDLAMFEAVNYKVAMANATPELKEQADEITPIAEEDGIFKSFQKNGLI